MFRDEKYAIADGLLLKFMQPEIEMEYLNEVVPEQQNRAKVGIRLAGPVVVFFVGFIILTGNFSSNLDNDEGTKYDLQFFIQFIISNQVQHFFFPFCVPIVVYFSTNTYFEQTITALIFCRHRPVPWRGCPEKSIKEKQRSSYFRTFTVTHSMSPSVLLWF